MPGMKLGYLLATLASLAIKVNATTNAWHIDYIYNLVQEELDPIINPNGQSSHMHSVIGTAAFGANYNHDDYVAAPCTSLYMQADKSAYWIPQLYWYDPSLGAKPFIAIRNTFRFYYFLTRSSPVQAPVAYPKGLRILAGDPNNKAPSVSIKYNCNVNADLSNPITSNNFNYNNTCPYGIKSTVYYPQCWNGKDLWLPGSAHMSYPADTTNVRDNPCPINFPVRVPQIQLETTWYPAEVAPGQNLAGHLIWANGDLTGYGLHGDFVEGWDTDLLNSAINNTGCNVGGEMPMQNCPVFTPYWDGSTAQNCKPTRGMLVEPEGNGQNNPVSKLPGCNLPWSSGPKPACSGNPQLNLAGLTGPDGAYSVPANERQDFVMPTQPGWSSIGCLSSMNAIINPIQSQDSALTVERCQASCGTSGYSFAGLGTRGGQPTCVCGNSLASNAAISPGMCTQPCPGNSKEMCGSSGDAFEFYYAPNGTQFNTTSTYYTGCLQQSGTNNLLSQTFYNYTSYQMSDDVCAQTCVNLNATYFATRRGSDCFCGTNYNIGTDIYVDSSYCTIPCNGNSSQICGDNIRASVYNLTNSAYAPSKLNKPAGYQGCYQKPAGGFSLPNSTWTTTSMTPESCMAGCNTLGFKYSAVDRGSYCSCGDTFSGYKQLPASECNVACSGNSSETCGATLAMELYLSASSPIDLAQVAAQHPVGWMGCYVDSNTNIALKDYSYTSGSMTVEVCKTACKQFGYGYAGLDVGNECTCGKAAPTTVQVSYVNCGRACAGNSSETCGGNGYADIYNATSVSSGPGASNATGYKGCFQDAGGKGLTAYTFKTGALTIDSCRTGCKYLGYSLAALEAGNQCYCGNSWAGGMQLPDSSCTQACAGNSSQICGAGSIASLYSTDGAPAPVARPDSWLGCYSDNTSKRVLGAYLYTSSSGMTITVCRATCAQQGYALAGVENGNQCYCDNIETGASLAPVTLCSLPCSGNSTQLCGGSSVIDIYNATGATARSNGLSGFLGCYNDYGSVNDYGFSTGLMSAEMCQQVCIARGYKFSANRNGAYCYCGKNTANSLTTTATCNIPCAGAANETCGASTQISVYDLSKTDIHTGAIDTSYDSTGYVGCFQNVVSPVLDTQVLMSNSLTNAMCVASCGQLGYAYAGTRANKYCYCGANLNSTSFSYRQLPSTCNTPCTGNSAEMCGAADKLSVWNVAGTGIKADSTGREGYTGCYSAGTSFTAAPYTVSMSQMTATMCRRICRNKGYADAVLSATNCACEDASLVGPVVALQNCRQGTCPGNSTEICAGSGYVSMYDTTGPGAYPPSGYPTDYIGCFSDSTGVLNKYTYSSAAMTSSMCGAICKNQGYSVFGTASKTCYCGSGYPVSQVYDSQCSTACAGSSSEMCGGTGTTRSVYDLNYKAYDGSTQTLSSVAISTSTSASASKSSSVSSVSSVKVSSTTSTAKVSSTTSTAKPSSTTSTVKVSSTTSTAKVSSTTSTAKPSSTTSTVKASSTTSTAKASSTTSTVKESSTTFKPTTIQTGGLDVSTPVSGSHTTSTTSAKASDTSTAKGSTSTTSTAKASSTTSTAKVSSTTSTAKESSTTSTAKASSTTTSASKTSSSAVPSSTVTDPAYVGCYTQSTNVLSHVNMTCSSLVPNMCKLWCETNKYAYSGMGNGNYCGCSNDLTGLTKVADSQCSTNCVGDNTVKCGSTSAFSVYKSQVSGVTVNNRREISAGERDGTTKRFDYRHARRRAQAAAF